MADSKAPFTITPVPCRSDNYAYLITAPSEDGKSRVAAVVDPENPGRVLEALKTAGLEESQLVYALTTHHHADHAGGNEGLVAKVSHVQVVGGKGDNCAGATKTVWQDDELKLGTARIRVIAVPCHTRGHVAYLLSSSESKELALFSGDTLFNGGCGRFFEGTAAEMHEALTKLAALPDNTRVYSGHEYTVSNLRFGLEVEPENQHIIQKYGYCAAQRDRGEHTVPTTIAEERLINPFMRVTEEAEKKFTGKSDPIEVMDELRNRKNKFDPPAVPDAAEKAHRAAKTAHEPTATTSTVAST